MQLTRAADYAVRVMVHLAGLPEGTRASRSELAEAGDVPEHFVSKVLQQLVRAGLVSSFRGMAGGFGLAVPARHVSVLRIIEAMEGPLALNLCMMSPNACDRQSWCVVHPIWAEAQAAMAAVLRRATIDRLAAEASRPRPRREE